MSRSEGSVGFQAERARLVADLQHYVREWEQALQRGDLSNPRLTSLLQASGGLQGRARSVGFGGIALHLAELERAFGAGERSAVALQARLQVVADLLGQAIHELSQGEQRAVEALAAPNVPPLPSQSVRPPRLITVVRHGESALPGAALPPPPLESPLAFGPSQGVVSAQPLGEQRASPHPALVVSPPPFAPERAAAPIAAAPLPAAPNPSAAPPNFSVRSMLGLRGFGRDGGQQPLPQPPAVAPLGPAASGAPAVGSSLLGLRRISEPVARVSQPLPVHPGPGAARGAAPSPPPLVSGDPAALAPLRADAAAPLGGQRPVRVEPSGAHRLLRNSRPDRESSPPKGRPAARRRRQLQEPSRGGWWVGLLAALGVAVGIAAIAGIVLWSRGGSTPVAVPSTVGSTGSLAGPPGSESPGGGRALPRERLLADNERLQSLLTQVHGRGGKESPELRALVDEQAALAARALDPKNCQGNSAACAAWSKVREVLIGPEGKPVIKRRGTSGTNSVPSRWLAGLKMPEIPVEDDPRVQRQFEFYTENIVGRETFQSMLFRCGAYRDLIQSSLIRHGLPMDLLAVVFAESSCLPKAKSPVGAEGLWQFMPETARAYHLRVQEGVVDERHSPPKSTEAAIRFLSDLRQKLGSWDLVFAAYNMGPFGLMARIERAGGDLGFWDLVDADLLPDETANYAPSIQAIALILNNLPRLKFAGTQMRSPQVTADLEVPAGTRLGLIARAAATSTTQIRTLNLDIVGDSAPNLRGFSVQVPKDVVWQARDALKELVARGDDGDLCVSPAFDWGRQRFTAEMAKACRKNLGPGQTAQESAAPADSADPN